jgi:hypothetical protein
MHNPLAGRPIGAFAREQQGGLVCFLDLVSLNRGVVAGSDGLLAASREKAIVRVHNFLLYRGRSAR